MFKSSLVTTYFVDFRASTDTNLFEEALTTFNERGNSDTELVDFLRNHQELILKKSQLFGYIINRAIFDNIIAHKTQGVSL